VCDLDQIKSVCPQNTPCFILYNENPGILFCYISPPQSPIRNRMMFAASRGYFVQTVEAILGSKIDKKFESDSCLEFLQDLEDRNSNLSASASVSASANKLAFPKPSMKKKVPNK
jgi:hypothetical protein